MDKWLANNTAAKVIALAVAVLLWAMVHVDTDAPTITRTTQGNQTITNLAIEPYGFNDEKYVLQSITPQRVSVEISGQRSQMTSLLTSSEYQVKMDLSKISEPGQYTVPLEFDPPGGVELLSIEPSRVTITVEEKVTQEFDAVILTTGVPAEGFTELDPVFAEGNKVQVTLPASEMKQVQKIQGEMSVEGSNESVSGRVKLVAYANNGAVLDHAVIVPSSIKVQIPISSNVSSKTLPLNISYSGSLPNGLVLSGVQAETDQVKLYGPDSVLEGLDSFPPITVDLSKITKEGTSTFTKSLSAPTGVDRIEPSSIDYTVTVVPYEQKVIENVPITLTGQKEDMEVTITDPASKRMNVTVVGASERLSDITAEDINLTADISDLQAGTHHIQLDVILPDYIEMKDSSPLSITVEIASAAEETEPPAPETTSPEVDTPPDTQTPNQSGETTDPPNTDPAPPDTPANNNSVPNDNEINTEQPESTEDEKPAEGETTDPGQTQPSEGSGQDGEETPPEPGSESGGTGETEAP
ncbi:CdaR family protein [Saccharibacillus kuerlensis]|uniref:YbbR domain-containing protein n=1 Tax=Saccharibacillus kuerlensis TaxID=459527 RepID=A0ABQ2L9V9_9BACL|nr:CdaR family protein [Saccharibacillus kuerlensis]GGO08001.1 hypothetical protein GCM10010969_37030 [Saccharibacillus kuerlensis]